MLLMAVTSGNYFIYDRLAVKLRACLIIIK